MLFGKKSDRELPDLPPSPLARAGGSGAIPPVDSLEMEDRSLPSFPDSPTHNKFSQAAIKDAVGEIESEDEIPEFPEMDAEKKEMTEMEEWNPSGMSDMRKSAFRPSGMARSVSAPRAEPSKEAAAARSVRAMPMSMSMPEEASLSPRVTDVFVKIDKYHAAKKSLGDIAGKLEEIDNLIKRIRDTKLKEEQELALWEKDVTHIKARLQDITVNIFEKLE